MIKEWFMDMFTSKMPDGILFVILILVIGVAGLCVSILWADRKERKRK